ncbi:MAG: Stage V sporulation protein E [Candidatus Yanofskybacteria bacterium GW2011_GWF1_44_227]|uniref:Probable peptidoglycan glycosyltransferase FtsW n=1 Tax=Candidatus Yanofskybacteria bacterium GW2011_GWE2_40_11 TaxID=1619033 RepID=A0A0G0QK87_9BACT|nr:MAG: Stage V sporulation protein E [Candidatus Yanofskybacteria bacterium GW2011_GWE1_40_10]KKR40829.1 MAG: Stage V sporulation protein E [Candidatus Yanofskybacteria bacterium GW2011_GWE2_40_11]KKT15944.1 MAG: Stage V sporulation protein E [Candidatus Yanofskybacteria bacterium GW2011_GWF2_43_596]KKT53542.1 MAG: Stage V sporulation protein E [Candidatus Yanofskybacteria bacterium GW2011_GWF1_44_227]OGN38087.1 MAG: cell division protein FtsW [Candidatus Yanofskybacteria bacterium RIFOXYB2_FU
MMAKSLIWITLVSVVFGLVMLSSAGIIDAQKKFGNSYYYFYHQLLQSVLPGLALLFIFFKINYKVWKKLAIPILFFALLLMTFVFLPQFGHGAKGATRWLELFGFRFQPSEFLKMAMIIYLAAWFSGRDERLKNWTYGMAPFFVVLAFVAALLALQPDIGTLLIVSSISIGVYFAAGVEMKHFFTVIGVFLLIGIALVIFEPYRFNRLKTFMNPDIDPRGISYQVNQSFIAIGSGGLLGVGFGKSSQKQGFLPEVVGDSIFAVIAEELGFIGAVATLLMFIALCFTLTRIAKNTRDKFGLLLVMGVNIWICSQALLNIAANCGIAPLTGVPLPFISYGGSAMMAILSGIGISASVAKR